MNATKEQRTSGKWWFAAHDATTYAVGVGDRELAVFERRVDAEFVARTANAHEATITALRDARDALADLNQREEDGGALLDRIDAALARVAT